MLVFVAALLSLNLANAGKSPSINILVNIFNLPYPAAHGQFHIIMLIKSCGLSFYKRLECPEGTLVVRVDVLTNF